MDKHGNYYVKVVKRIGNGSFGYVEEVELYNLHNKKCDGQYARKVFSPTKDVIITYAVDTDTLRKRFIKEAKSQASCIHSNVAHIYIYNLDAEIPWFIMGLAENDLSEDINNPNMSISDKINALTMIISGLKCIHSNNFLHRDIKPQNILKFSNGNYCISDFGLVRDLNNGATVLTQIAMKMGTKNYMAPEIEIAATYSIQSDIYALGVVIEELNIDFLSSIVARCCNRKPSDRYKNIDELESDLHKLIRVNCND